MTLCFGFLERTVIDMATTAEGLSEEYLLLLSGIARKLEALHEGAGRHSGWYSRAHGASFL